MTGLGLDEKAVLLYVICIRCPAGYPYTWVTQVRGKAVRLILYQLGGGQDCGIRAGSLVPDVIGARSLYITGRSRQKTCKVWWGDVLYNVWCISVGKGTDVSRGDICLLAHLQIFNNLLIFACKIKFIFITVNQSSTPLNIPLTFNPCYCSYAASVVKSIFWEFLSESKEIWDEIFPEYV